MSSCNTCHAAVPNDAETCPQCGNLISKGFLASLFGMFRAKPVEAPKPGVASAAASTSSRPRDSSGGFSMKIEDVFTISGRGTVVTGNIASGEIRIGDAVRIVSGDGTAIETNVTGIEMFRKIVNEAKAGDNVGLLLRGVKQKEVQAGATIELA